MIGSRSLVLRLLLLGIRLCLGDDDAVSFLVVGDWGEDSVGQWAAAEGMEVVANGMAADFVVMAGDNFYETGIHGNPTPRFQKTFEDVYKGPTLEKLKFFAIAGNHDHKGNVQCRNQI